MIFGVLVIVLSAILTINIGVKSSSHIEEEIGTSLAGVSYQMADKLDHFMYSRAGEINILSKLEVIRNPEDIQAVQSLLDELKSSFPTFSWVGLTNKEGHVIASTDRLLEGVDISSRPVYVEALEETFIGDVHDAKLLAEKLPSANGEPVQFVDISIPIHNELGEFNGVLASHLSWEWSKMVEQTIIEPLQKEKKRKIDVFIVSSKDNVVLLGPDELVGESVSLESVSKAQSGENGWSLEQWPDGKNYLTGYAFGKGYLDYQGLGWTILVRQPETVAYESVNELQHYIITIGVIVTILTAVLGWFLAGNITKPLHRISKASQQLKNGEDVAIPYVKGIKEIETLSLSLRELITSLVSTEEKLDKMETLAHQDKLTGLPNRLALEHYLPRIIEKADKEGTIVSFLYIDLDDFKEVNDTLGHHAGDLLLREVGERLQQSIRNSEHAFRIGGDEFLVLLSTSRSENIANSKLVAKRIIAKINSPYFIENESVLVGCSIGISSRTEKYIETKELIQQSDQALYKAKEQGKNNFAFYNKLEK